jgi:hypothetical protein
VIKEDKMGRACNIHGRGEKCTQNIGQIASREEITWKIEA